jgi:hypothetical protein
LNGSQRLSEISTPRDAADKPMIDRWLARALLCLGLALSSELARGEESATTLLPDVSVSLRAARYFPSDPDFQETGWIGAGAGIVKTHGATAYFTADLETVIGDVVRLVDPNQANYHLELGVDRPFDDGKLLNVFFHHVSRHLVDRFKDDTVDWNVLGIRGAVRLPRSSPVPGRLHVSAGHTTRASLIGYQWEFIARLEGDLLPSRSAGPYYDFGARLVTTTPSPSYPRTDFLDGYVEGGWRFRRADRSLDLFAAYEHRNDASILVLGARNALLIGFHIGAGPSRDPWYWR